MTLPDRWPHPSMMTDADLAQHIITQTRHMREAQKQCGSRSQERRIAATVEQCVDGLLDEHRRRNEPPASPAFCPGQRVRHASLGEGTIRTVTDNGTIAIGPDERCQAPDVRLVIDFDHCGARELLLAFAAPRLEIIE